jgi:hypothetical protein
MLEAKNLIVPQFDFFMSPDWKAQRKAGFKKS